MVQEKVAAVSAVASETGFDPTAFSRLRVAGNRDGVRQSSGLARGHGPGAIGIGTRHLCARTLTCSARKTSYDKTSRGVGRSARSCRAGGWGVSGAGSTFEMTNEFAGEQRPVLIADFIVLHS